MFFTVSALGAFGAFCLIAVFSAGRIKTAGDYSMAGGRAGALSVAGILLGVVVAGGATIGTVQMSYQWGISGLWFTFGSGVGCALLGLRFAEPVRRSRMSTLTSFLEQSFGYPTAVLTLVSSVLGSLIAMAAQFLAGVALLRSTLPVSAELASFLLCALILAMIFSGGIASFGAVGAAKAAALCLLLTACCAKAVSMGQTPGVIFSGLPGHPWFNVFARGPDRELGAFLSVLAGILCTQIYMQAVLSASGEREARRGALIAAFLTPPLGLMGVWVGLALRNAGIEIEPAQALPYFLKTYFHPAVAGALWAVLAITVVGGAAGHALGVATNLSHDVYRRFMEARNGERHAAALRLSRALVVGAVVLAACIGLALRNDLILGLSYLALGLRSAGTAVPLVCAIFFPRLLSPKTAFLSSILGLGTATAAWLFSAGVDPLILGLAVSSLPLLWAKLTDSRG